MKYQSYKSLYRQKFTIPINFLDDFNIDVGKVAVFFFLFLVNSIFLGLIALGGKSILFVPRPIIALILTIVQYIVLLRVPTAGKPLILWVLYVFYFTFFVKKQTYAFRPFKLKNKVKEDWTASFRSVVVNDKKIHFTDVPLNGEVEKFDGLSLQTHGATRIKFFPISKKVRIEVGDYDKLKKQSVELNKYKPTKIEVGRGDVRILRRNGKSVVQYNPITETEE